MAEESQHSKGISEKLFGLHDGDERRPIEVVAGVVSHVARWPKRRCIFGAFYAATRLYSNPTNGPPSLLPPSFIAAAPAVSFGCCTVIIGPTDPLSTVCLSAVPQLPPIPIMGCQTAEKAYCEHPSQMAEDSSCPKVKDVLVRRHDAVPRPASLSATGALSRCTVSEEEAGTDASFKITRRRRLCVGATYIHTWLGPEERS